MFKAYMDVGEPRVHSNGLDFETAEEARLYALDLYSRWTLVRRWLVIESAAIHMDKPEAEARAVFTGP